MKNYDKEKLSLLKYVEITNLQDNNITGIFKKKQGSRIAKEGDILFPRNASLNWQRKIVLVKHDFKISSAIYTLTFADNDNGKNIREYIYNYLKNNQNEVFEDIKALLDGFKISYSKISEFNLMNNIYFAKED